MYYLPDNFASFFRKLNVNAGTEAIASREYNAIKALLENPSGAAKDLSPECFLQGSYKQQTAIHDLNDIDVVALCSLWHPGSGAGSKSWGRDEIYRTIAAPLLADARYKDKVRYGPNSMCVKVDLGIKVEILPVVYKSGNYDSSKEPFRLYRPRTGQWEDGFARYHQQWLTWKNRNENTSGNFIPAIKVLKHLRTRFGLEAVSFHIEALMFQVPNATFAGSPPEYVAAVLGAISSQPTETWYRTIVKTPCGDRDIFTEPEWTWASWLIFHKFVAETLAPLARSANNAVTRVEAVEIWRTILGEDYFPD